MFHSAKIIFINAGFAEEEICYLSNRIFTVNFVNISHTVKQIPHNSVFTEYFTTDTISIHDICKLQYTVKYPSTFLGTVVLQQRPAGDSDIYLLCENEDKILANTL